MESVRDAFASVLAFETDDAFFVSQEAWLSVQVAMARFHYGIAPSADFGGGVYQAAKGIASEWLTRRSGESIALARALPSASQSLAASYEKLATRIGEGATDVVALVQAERERVRDVTGRLEPEAHALATTIAELATRGDRLKAEIVSYNARQRYHWAQLPDTFVVRFEELARFLNRLRGLMASLDADLEFVLTEVEKPADPARPAVLKMRLATAARVWARLGLEATAFGAYAFAMPETPATLSVTYGEGLEGGPRASCLTVYGGTASLDDGRAGDVWFLLPCDGAFYYLAEKATWTLLTAVRDNDTGWRVPNPTRVTGRDDQKWQLVPADDDRVFIQSKTTGTCVAAETDRGGTQAHLLRPLLPASADRKPYDGGTANLRWRVQVRKQ